MATHVKVLTNYVSVTALAASNRLTDNAIVDSEAKVIRNTLFATRTDSHQSCIQCSASSKLCALTSTAAEMIGALKNGYRGIIIIQPAQTGRNSTRQTRVCDSESAHAFKGCFITGRDCPCEQWVVIGFEILQPRPQAGQFCRQCTG